jgi:release factor glutamine methyltransferase
VQAECDNEKVFNFCRKHYSALTKKQLIKCFAEKIVYINDRPVRGSLDASRRLRLGESVKIVWDSDVAKRQKVSAITVDVAYQDSSVIVVNKPPGANAAVGREYEEAVKCASTGEFCSDKRFNFFVWRLQKSLGGLHIIAKSVESMCRTREMLCTEELEVSCVCLVAGCAGDVNEEFDISCHVPTNTAQEEAAAGHDDDDEAEEPDNETEEVEQADKADTTEVGGTSSQVPVTVHVKVLSIVPCRSTDFISLISLTPRFDPTYMGLIENDDADASAAASAEGHCRFKHKFDILKPHDAADYACLHYPTFVLKNLPRVLRGAGLPLLGGEDGLVKRDKGLYFSVVGVVHNPPVAGTGAGLEPGVMSVSVPVPEKLTKLMDKEASLYEASIERDLETVRAARTLTGEEEEEETRAALRRGVPVEYILGRAVFCGNEFEVTGDVMVPRRSSESLVQTCVQDLLAVNKARSNDASDSLLTPSRRVYVLDVGSGSGCLLLSSLTQLREQGIDCAGVGIDICPKALDVARRNATALGLADRTCFLQHSFEDLADLVSVLAAASPGGLLDAGDLVASGGFDAILCNPPYSSMKEARLSRSRITHEPAIALFAEGRDLAPGEDVSRSRARKDPYRAFTTIVSSLGKALQNRTEDSPLLKEDGLFVLEFGHRQGGRVRGLFERCGWLRHARSIVDYNKLERGFVFKRRREQKQEDDAKKTAGRTNMLQCSGACE